MMAENRDGGVLKFCYCFLTGSCFAPGDLKKKGASLLKLLFSEYI